MDPTAVTQALRLAVVGAGSIGRRHVDYLLQEPGVSVAALADPSAAARTFANERGVRHFEDHRAMLDATPLDGVIVATPNALHEEVAIACMERGIAVLIEKPIAHSLASASRIVDAVARTRVPVLVGHHRRHNPLLAAAREFIASGAIGGIVTIAAIDLRRKPDAYYDMAWRREPGGGPLLINGIHDLDCLRWLCGDIESVYAITSTHTRGFAVEDTAAVTFKFQGGAIGNLTISDAVEAPWAWEIAAGEEPDYPHEHEDTYLVCGTTGSLAIPTLTHWRNERGGGRRDPFVRTRLFYVPADPWLEELRHFVQIIRGEARPLTDVVDATRTLATALAITRSAQSGVPVDVESMYRAA